MVSQTLRGALAGAIGGLIGSSVMVAFNHLLAAVGVGEDDLGRREQHHRVAAKPNDTDATIPDEPATIKAASNFTEAVTGEPLRGWQRQRGGAILHHVFGALVGGAYGAVAVHVPAVTSGAGAPYGAGVWLTAAELGVPLAGLSRSPEHYPAVRHAASLAAHLAFGLTVEATRRRLTPRDDLAPSGT